MPSENELFIGLMSGTSIDAIDAALVRFSDEPSRRVELLATHEHPFPSDTRAALIQLIESPHVVDLDQLGQLDRSLGLLYADAVNTLLRKSNISAENISAIGNHGQTIRHRPDATPPFTLQIGDAATIANACGIATVADFRSADVALGGQGAPLAPAFHQWAFTDNSQPGFVVNIGGLANVTVLRPGEPLIGFDTGPGNTLLDAWCMLHQKANFDADGRWASSGQVDGKLLQSLLADPYFAKPAPKSTGREHFNPAWLNSKLAETTSASAADVQATLAELTAQSIATAINDYTKSGNVWLCGGGALNADLITRIKAQLPLFKVASTAALGVPPAWVEAVAFAWLARERMRLSATGMPSVTGASASGLQGSINLPPENSSLPGES